MLNFETGNPPEGWESEGQIRNYLALLYAPMQRTTDH
jgi:hypothetical protein